MLTQEEFRALLVLCALLALGAGIRTLEARHPRVLALTLGDSLALGADGAEDPGDGAASGTDVADAGAGAGPGGEESVPGPDTATGAGAAGSAAAAGSAGAAGAAPERASAAWGLDGRLDLNLASAQDLELLPGIGPRTAARVLEDRARNGPYRRVEDLLRVRGIGPKTLARLKPLAAVRARRESAAAP